MSVNLPVVAEKLKMIIIAVIVNIGLNIASKLLLPTESIAVLIAFLVVALGVTAFIMLNVYQITNAMGWSTGLSVLCIVLMLVPCANLITLVIISVKASQMLKAGGYEVGLMGAKPK